MAAINAIIKAMITSTIDSLMNCLIRVPLPAPITFLRPTSFERFVDRAVAIFI